MNIATHTVQRLSLLTKTIVLFFCAYLGCRTPLLAQVLELRVDGTVQSNLATPGPHSADPNVMGYDRIWEGGIYQQPASSSFAYPTLSQPWDPLYGNRSYSIVGQPFTLKLLIDTSLIPSPSSSSSFAASSYSSLVFGWFQSPTLQPFTPWMSASLTLNNVTRSYLGDYYSTAALTDYVAANPNNSPRSTGNFSLKELSAPLEPWVAGYYDISGINLQFDLPIDFLNGASLDQSFNFSTAETSGLAGVSGNFSLWETSFVNGARTSLSQTTGLLNAHSLSIRTLSQDSGSGSGAEGTPMINAVPEPSTYALCGASSLGLLAFWRRRCLLQKNDHRIKKMELPDSCQH